MRAVIYQHEAHETEHLIGQALEGAGFKLVRRFRAVAHHEDVTADLLVVMGGNMGVGDSDAHPFLREELGVLSERLAVDRPCLGVCLGAQLMAAALGAQVSAGKNGFEVGVAPVRWTEAARVDPVVGPLFPRSTVAHWHGDTWTPLEGASLLASTDRYTQQAVRVGKSYGFQFHVELTADAFGRWLELGAVELEARGKDPAALRAQVPKLAAAEPSNRALLERLAAHFARCLG